MANKENKKDKINNPNQVKKRGRPPNNSGFNDQLYRKTYQAINYQFLKATKKQVQMQLEIVKKTLPKTLSEIQVKEILKKNKKAQLDYLRQKTQTQNIVSYYRQRELLNINYRLGNKQKIKNYYKQYAVSEQALQYKKNINKAIDSLSLADDIKERIKAKVMRMNKTKLKQYESLIEKLLQHYDDEQFIVEMESLALTLGY